MPRASHTPSRRARYEPSGFLALDPRAFGWLFDVPEGPEGEVRDGVAIVSVRGPLEHHDDGFWWDSYEAIVERVAKALEGAPKAVVLSIDSPGGLVSGCFDSARTLRAMARTAKVPLYAFVDGMATSAAYALASAADRIFVTDTSMTGSIGVIEALVDARAANEKFGVRVQLITSGARKADGHPAAEITEDVVRVAQDRVDQLALSFFELVAEMRGGLSVNALRALEASIVIGADAVRLGLADELATMDQVLAIASGEKEETMSTKTKASAEMDDAIAKLRKAAESDDEEEAAKAKKMLAAMDDEDDKDECKGKGKAEEPEKDECKAKSKAEEDPPAEKKDDEEVKASTPVKLASRIQSLEAKLAAKEEAEKKAAEQAEREKLLASRPDFAPEALEVLRDAPLATVKHAVEKWPRSSVRIPHNPHAASAQPGATRGEGQGTREPLSDQARAMDEKMGIRRHVTPVAHEGTSTSLRTLTKAEAREYARKREAAAAAAGATRA